MFNKLFGPKHYYKTYVADAKIYPCNIRLAEEILSYNPKSVFEFGCGVGKNLDLLRQMSNGTIMLKGIDISAEAVKRARQNSLDVILGTEDSLTEIALKDIAFTCSVLDHIKDIDFIISELKYIANKVVILLETNDIPAKFYYPHNYERYGFVKTNYKYISSLPEGDGATYHLWKWERQSNS